MLKGKFSRTAQVVAAVRGLAAKVGEDDCLSDPLAARILGGWWRVALEVPGLRWFVFAIVGGSMIRGITCAVLSRSRLAEDRMRALAAAGPIQYVVLGAGLDTIAYRTQLSAEQVSIFEVDFPATQALKRRRVIALGLEAPANLIYVACDFERDSLTELLGRAGFASSKPTVIAWLGILPYLTQPAISAVLEALAEISPPGSEIIFDYYHTSFLAPDAAPDARRIGAAAARRDEPMTTVHSVQEIESQLRSAGWELVDNWGPAELTQTYFNRPARYARDPFPFARLARAVRR